MSLRPVLFAIAILPLLNGCTGALSTLDPAGPAAASIATLWWLMFWASVALFLLIAGLLWAVWRRPGFGKALAPMRWIIWGGLAMPGVLLTALVGYALVTGERLLPHTLDQPPTRVVAHGVMWQWHFSYPDNQETLVTSVLHIPAGEPVDVIVTSGDVIHSFWVPRLAGKIDAIPGHENTIRIQADRPGTYRGVCAEFCGDGHTEMRFTIEAHERASFETLMAELADV
ncbi:cytochrome c oxidase subunit II [Pelagibacterium sp.]|uniref:cytochrome c oxidase subunit II n=1 Tax=Pelagibacterium sp. TaxID=1967288 RepID=UPI003A912EAC